MGKRTHIEVGDTKITEEKSHREARRLAETVIIMRRKNPKEMDNNQEPIKTNEK